MNRRQIVDKMTLVIERNLNLRLPDQVSESDRLYEDLNIDSIMVLQLVVYLEEEFGVEVPEEAVDPAVFRTIGSLVTFIEQLLDTRMQV